MASVRDIRQRIRSVRNTQKVTKAMKMVAAAKLRRAQERIIQARPYAERMLAVLNSLATRAQRESHPLLAERGAGKIELVIITADKGMCGGFNANIVKRAVSFMEENAGSVLTTQMIGRKGRDFFRRRRLQATGEHIELLRDLKYEQVAAIAREIMKRYIECELDAVHVVYNEFKSVIQQRVVIEQLLPIRQLQFDEKVTVQDYIYEPSPEELFDDLLPRHVEFQLLRAMLESAAAEFGARMTAMDAATNNATEMIDTLTLTMNRVRQAAITKEIIEVVSGAEAT